MLTRVHRVENKQFHFQQIPNKISIKYRIIIGKITLQNNLIFAMKLYGTLQNNSFIFFYIYRALHIEKKSTQLYKIKFIINLTIH